MTDIRININGMSCQHCVQNVKKALEALGGVTAADVEIGRAKVTYDESKLNRTDLEAAVVKAGYKIAG